MATGLSNASGLSATGSSLILGARGLAGSGSGLTSGSGLGGGTAGAIFDFTTGVLPSGMTFARSTVATGFNSALVLTDFPPQTPRFVYDPVTGVRLGLLVENGRTNSLRNSTMVGAVPGSPGTVPTNWASSAAPAGITRTIIGTGVEDGIEYIDIQYAGTIASNTSYSLTFEAANQIAAANGQIWAASLFVRLLAGSLTGITLSRVLLSERDSGGSSISGGGTQTYVPTTAALRTQRAAVVATFTNALTAFTTPSFNFTFNTGFTIDVTLRIGLPQLEIGYCAASNIRTSTVAVARGRDDAFITNPRVLTDSVIIARGRTPPAAEPTSGNRMIQRDAGAAAESTMFYRSAGGNLNLVVTAGNVSQAAVLGGSPGLNTDIGVAIRAATNDFACSMNGGAVGTDTAGNMPATPTLFRVGGSSSATLIWQGTIKSVETRATASDAELVTLSAASAGLTDTELWMTAVTANGGSVSMARKAIVEQFIAAEKAAGTWQLTDDYWPMWGENTGQALTSLKQRRLATMVNGPTVATDRGFTFNGSTQYIDTGFIPTTHTTTMTGTNYRLAVYERTNFSGNVTSTGVQSTAPSHLAIRARSGGSINVFLGALMSWALPSANSQGYTVASRNGPDETACAVYKNGLSLTMNSVTPPFSANLPSHALYVGGRNNAGVADSFRACQVGFVAIGAQISAAQELAHYNNVQAWATAIGAQV